MRKDILKKLKQIQEIIDDIVDSEEAPISNTVRMETPFQYLLRTGIDPETAWSDDPGLNRRQRAALRSIGRNSIERKWVEAGRPGPKNHGM